MYEARVVDEESVEDEESGAGRLPALVINVRWAGAEEIYCWNSAEYWDDRRYGACLWYVDRDTCCRRPLQ